MEIPLIQRQEYRRKILKHETCTPATNSSLSQKDPKEHNKKLHERVRKLSTAVITNELKQLEKRNNYKSRKLKSAQSMNGSHQEPKSLKDIAYQNQIKRDIQVRAKGLAKYQEALPIQYQESLQYQTFKMVQQRQKSKVITLQQKLTINIKSPGRSSLPADLNKK